MPRWPPGHAVSQGRPQRCTPMMPVVRAVMWRSMAAGSILCVRGSMSTNTGVIPCHWRAWAVAMNVKEGTRTSPLRSSARAAISRAIVALHIATQCLTPTRSASRASSSLTKGPSLDSHRRLSMSATRERKARRSPRLGRPTCTRSENIGRAPRTARPGRRADRRVFRVSFDLGIQRLSFVESGPGGPRTAARPRRERLDDMPAWTEDGLLVGGDEVSPDQDGDEIAASPQLAETPIEAASIGRDHHDRIPGFEALLRCP